MKNPKVICECGREMVVTRTIPKLKGGREIEFDMQCDCGTQCYLLFISEEKEE